MADRRKITVRLPEDDLEWLEETYPKQGAKQWFFTMALRRFREHHEVSPEDITDEAVRSMDLTD